MQIEFGPFVLDTERRRLLKYGISLHLRDQPLQVLAALLAHPGEIVTRSELRRRLWSDLVFVEFDVALNSAVSRLRQALGDPARAPRLIETVPKHGYRFIGSVARSPSIAIMPFSDQSSGPENRYLSEGLSDELIRALSRIKGLRVAGRSIVARYQHQHYDLRQAGREIGVDAVLEGSVRRIGDSIRISVQLVNVSDGIELWSRLFETEWNEVTAIQARLSQGVAEALKVQFATHGPADHTHNAQAYMCYLRGHHLIKHHTHANAERGLEYFREAIRIDPDYALPYHGAALYYILAAMMGELPPSDGLRQAEDLLSRGLSLDGQSAMLLSTLGMLRMFQWRWDEAEWAYQRAMDLEPANAYVRMMHALQCSFLGRHQDALRQAETALQLEPLDPMTNFRIVQSEYYARRYEAAVRTGRMAIELARHFPYTRWYVGWSLVALGRTDEAWEMASEERAVGPRQPLSEGQFGYVAAASGHTRKAHQLIGELSMRRERGYFPALPFAWTYLGLGNTEACLDWLDVAFAEQEPYLGSIGVFPGYDPVRNQPRFRALMRKVQRPETAAARATLAPVKTRPGFAAG